MGVTRQTMFGRGGNERAHPSGRKNDKDSSRGIRKRHLGMLRPNSNEPVFSNF
jgi:hypothetical protein